MNIRENLSQIIQHRNFACQQPVSVLMPDSEQQAVNAKSLRHFAVVNGIPNQNSGFGVISGYLIKPQLDFAFRVYVRESQNLIKEMRYVKLIYLRQ